MTVAPTTRSRASLTWHSFETWVGTRSSAIVLFALALGVFALQSVVLPAYPGRDMGRYVQAYLQLAHENPVLPTVANERGPLAAFGVGLPLELGGVAAEVWLAMLYAGSIVAWGAIAHVFGSRAAILTSGVLLAFPGYGILFHGLASDALFAAGFAAWTFALSRAILKPSRAMFFVTGVGMGMLVLVRPSNQALIVFTLLPLVLRASWGRRLAWLASYFIGSALVTQGWMAFAALNYGDGIWLQPSTAVVVAALGLSALLVPAAWRRGLALGAVPVAVLAIGVLVWRGPDVQSPVHYVRSAAQSPSSGVFLFRAFEIDRTVSPDNGPASQELGRIVERELLSKEPYRSYGVGLDEFFSSGSDRIFQDLQVVGGGADLEAVAREAIRAHPWAFTTGTARALWAMLWTGRVYADVPAPGNDEATDAEEEPEPSTVVVNGRELPAPSEGEPIPASRFGRAVLAQNGTAREVWRSATKHPLVFDDVRDERRYLQFESDTARLAGRIPTRGADPTLAHRFNQASKAFPPLIIWLIVGVVAVAMRRPRHALVAIAPAAAGLVVTVATALVAFPVPHYVVPMAPAFVLLAAAGLVGSDPRGRLKIRGALAHELEPK